MQPVRTWLTPAEFLERHEGQIGRTTLYARLRDGSIPCARVGDRKYLIPADALERLLMQAREQTESTNPGRDRSTA